MARATRGKLHANLAPTTLRCGSPRWQPGKYEFTEVAEDKTLLPPTQLGKRRRAEDNHDPTILEEARSTPSNSEQDGSGASLEGYPPPSEPLSREKLLLRRSKSFDGSPLAIQKTGGNLLESETAFGGERSEPGSSSGKANGTLSSRKAESKSSRKQLDMQLNEDPATEKRSEGKPLVVPSIAGIGQTTDSKATGDTKDAVGLMRVLVDQEKEANDPGSLPLTTYKLRRRRGRDEPADEENLVDVKVVELDTSEAEGTSSDGCKQMPARFDKVLRDRAPKVGKYGLPLDALELCKEDAVDSSKEKNSADLPAAPFPGVVGSGGHDFQSCKVCGKPEDATSTLLCDICNCAFHLQCIRPKLKRVHKLDEWLCASCVQQKQEEGTTIVFEDAEGVEGAGLNAFVRTAVGFGSNGPHDSRGGAREGPDRPMGSGPGGMGQWLLRGEHSLHGKIRIGPNYQAQVPDWTGKSRSGNDDTERPRFGEEVAMTQEEKDAMKREADERLDNDRWPLDWLPAKSLSEGTPEKWIQCTRILYDEGDVRPDGRVVRKPVDCGKWRRAPLHVEASPGWECSCAVVWDPKHAECSVPQELHKREIDRRAKLAALATTKNVECGEIMTEASKQKEAQAEEQRWEAKIRDLEAWKAQNGHCHVPLKEPLGQWLQAQRAQLHRGNLPAPRKSRLLDLGVVLDTQEARWEENFFALAAFQKEHGHCDVARHSGGKEGAKLAQWAKAQRQLARQALKNPGMLQKVCRLLELGFNFASERNSP